MKDKRKHQRIQFLRKVVIKSPGNDSMVLDVLDYSMGGISVFSKQPFAVGDILFLDSLTTLDGDERPLGLQAEVRHIQNHDSQGFVVGMEFKQETPVEGQE